TPADATPRSATTARSTTKTQPRRRQQTPPPHNPKVSTETGQPQGQPQCAGSGRGRAGGGWRAWLLRLAPSADSGARSWRVRRVGRTGRIGRRVAEAGVAGELGWGREAADVADLCCDRVGEHPTDSGRSAQQRHVAVSD